MEIKYEVNRNKIANPKAIFLADLQISITEKAPRQKKVIKNLFTIKEIIIKSANLSALNQNSTLLSRIIRELNVTSAKAKELKDEQAVRIEKINIIHKYLGDAL